MIKIMVIYHYNNDDDLNDNDGNDRCTVLEITVGHLTLSDQILKMSGQFHVMIGHDDRTCHQHILSSLLQSVVSQ